MGKKHGSLFLKAVFQVIRFPVATFEEWSPLEVCLVMGFQINASSTWTENSFYNLGLAKNLNYSGNGLYGYDTIGLGVQEGGLFLTGQVVAGIATKDFYLGIFGLGPKAANFSDFTDPKPSNMRTLVDRNLIPSLSFGYTARAPYRKY